MRTAADADRCGQDAKAAKEQWLLELRVRVHAGLGVGERNAARQPGKRRVPVDATVAGHVQEGNAGVSVVGQKPGGRARKHDVALVAAQPDAGAQRACISWQRIGKGGAGDQGPMAPRILGAIDAHGL